MTEVAWQVRGGPSYSRTIVVYSKVHTLRVLQPNTTLCGLAVPANKPRVHVYANDQRCGQCQRRVKPS